MSKLVAFAAIQGGYKVVSRLKAFTKRPWSPMNADTKIGFPTRPTTCR
jgi:acetyl-CoA synthase